MPKAISIHVGVDEVNAPEISVPNLFGCENDAIEMRDLAEAIGFEPEPLLINDGATFQTVFDAVAAAATKVDDGGIFLFTFSGHGTRRGTNDPSEAPDFKDETIVLHDRVMFDNVFRRVLWPKFPANTRILGISDSCHSGTALFSMPAVEIESIESLTSVTVAGVVTGDGALTKTSRMEQLEISAKVNRRISKDLLHVSQEQISRHFEVLNHFYSKVRMTIPDGPPPPLNASVLTLSACADHELTAPGLPNSAFTTALLKVWNGGSFQGNYDEFIAAIGELLPGQTPSRFPKDPQADAKFVDQRPFTI